MSENMRDIKCLAQREFPQLATPRDGLYVVDANLVESLNGGSDGAKLCSSLHFMSTQNPEKEKKVCVDRSVGAVFG